MNPFDRQTLRLSVPTVELVELEFNGTSNRYKCRVRVNGGPAVVARIATGYKVGGVVQFNGRALLVTEGCTSRGPDNDQIGKTILEFHAVDMAQVAAGLQDHGEGNMRSARTGKMTDGATAVKTHATFGPTARKLVL